jgi:hypothetical protein
VGLQYPYPGRGCVVAWLRGCGTLCEIVETAIRWWTGFVLKIYDGFEMDSLRSPEYAFQVQARVWFLARPGSDGLWKFGLLDPITPVRSDSLVRRVLTHTHP